MRGKGTEMVDVAEWPKWLNEIMTRLDDASSDEGPSARHGWARVPPTLRKELRDVCLDLHHTQREREVLRAALASVDGHLRAIIVYAKSGSELEATANDARKVIARAKVPATSCTCHAIQSADPRRHFRECPLRAQHPEV